jgi:hypothetical protein
MQYSRACVSHENWQFDHLSSTRLSSPAWPVANTVSQSSQCWVGAVAAGAVPVHTAASFALPESHIVGAGLMLIGVPVSSREIARSRVPSVRSVQLSAILALFGNM